MKKDSFFADWNVLILIRAGELAQILLSTLPCFLSKKYVFHEHMTTVSTYTYRVY